MAKIEITWKMAIVQLSFGTLSGIIGGINVTISKV